MRTNLRALVAGAGLFGAMGGLFHSTGGRPPKAEPTPPAAPVAPAQKPGAEAAVVARRAARAVLEGAGIESGLSEARTRKALDALAGTVTRQSDPDALQMAFRAYFNYREKHPNKVRKPYLYFVDYGLDSRTPRGYVFDMEALRVVDGPFTVAHGRGSASASSGVPTRFSNRHGSNATSLGLYLAQEIYSFRGKSGGRAYSSPGLRLTGVSGAYNSAARSRGVVVHGAPYVTSDRAGRSEGCPAVDQSRAKRLIPQIAHGGMVFLFSPLDREWMARDPWARLEVASRG